MVELPGYLLPGVASTLTALAQSDDCALGLLTGNSRRAAQIKLTHFAVDHWFLFGGFGDESTCRNEVARQALCSAGQHLQNRLDKNQIWVIGDTPLDVACGRAINARTVGVLTGGFDRAALQAAAPDFLLDDLQDFPRIIAAMS
jgi:phosphoglycolate phosphatase-like HAD superfamily hydrolase